MFVHNVFIIEPYNPYVKQGKKKTILELVEEEQLVQRIFEDMAHKTQLEELSIAAGGPPPFFPQSTGSVTSSVWPNGTDGALIINGTTLNMSASSKNYSSVSITNGGILNILGTSGSWMIIGCQGNFTIDSASLIRYNTHDWIVSGGGTSTTAPDSSSLSYTTDNGDSGDGGITFEGIDFDTLDPVASNSGGTTFFGNGGGGAASTITAGQGNGQNATFIHGGDGGWNQKLEDVIAAGGTATSRNGVSGSTGFATTPNFGAGCGGAGGYRGYAGGAIYIKVAGILNLSGSIHADGVNGGNGGRGGDGIDNPGSFGGGGGGGAAGGGGGKIVIRYKTGNLTQISNNCSVNPGSNGSAGDGGIAYNLSNTPSDIDPGNPDPPRNYMNGQIGNVGQVDPISGVTDISTY